MPQSKLSHLIRTSWQRGGVWSLILTVAFLGILGYSVTLSLFAASNLGQPAAVTLTGDASAPSYEIVLTDIDHGSRQLSFEVSSFQPLGKKSIGRCIWFVYSFTTSRGTTELADPVLVTLSEIDRNTLSPAEQPAETYTKYQGSGKFAFDTDLRKFPFDTVHFKVRFHSQCFVANAPVDHTPPGELTIKNRLTDYQLRQGIDTYLVLTRNSFLKVVAIVLLIVAFGGAIALIVQARSEWPKITVLTYFLGLWGTRDILQKPIAGSKAFPSVIEVTILFLFAFTIIGMSAVRYLTSDKQSDAQSK